MEIYMKCIHFKTLISVAIKSCIPLLFASQGMYRFTEIPNIKIGYNISFFRRSVCTMSLRIGFFTDVAHVVVAGQVIPKSIQSYQNTVLVLCTVAGFVLSPVCVLGDCSTVKPDPCVLFLNVIQSNPEIFYLTKTDSSSHTASLTLFSAARPSLSSPLSPQSLYFSSFLRLAPRLSLSLPSFLRWFLSQLTSLRPSVFPVYLSLLTYLPSSIRLSPVSFSLHTFLLSSVRSSLPPTTLSLSPFLSPLYPSM